VTGPRTLLKMWLKGRVRLIKWFFSRGPRKRGYMVDVAEAVAVLEKTNPAAAAWWRTNAKHLFRPGICLLFAEECCVVEARDGQDLK
jgi:hypothetical protein